MSQIYLTLANAPRVARAFENITPAVRALEEDPIVAFAQYGDDLAALCEVIAGPSIRDMPLHEALDAVGEALPGAFQAISAHIDTNVVPSIERLTELVVALTGRAESGEQAPEAQQ